MSSLSFWRTLAWALAAGVLLASAAAANPPSVHRPAPYPAYRVGDLASLHISTQPAQPNAPIYKFRYKDGQPEGPQPTLVGHTDSAGDYSLSFTVPAGIEGSYTGERYAVGSPDGLRSSPALSFTIEPAVQAPTVSRPAPYPAYEVGDTASLYLSTDPVQPNAPIYKFRLKDGQPEGQQPTLVAHTDALGEYSVTLVVPEGIEGSYSDERYAVGDPAGPTSPPLAFTISGPPRAPIVHRPAPFPEYQVGDTAVLEISTHPVQANAPIYRFRYKDGQPEGDQPTLVAHTDAQGEYSLSLVVPQGIEGHYSDERYAVGDAAGPTSPPLAFSIQAAPPSGAGPTVTRSAPYPHYAVGDVDQLTLTTQPVQAGQPVYRYRQKDGEEDGLQPTLVGFTDANGRFQQGDLFPAEGIGSYAAERYAVGDPDGPTSAPLAFDVAPGGSAGELVIHDLEPAVVDTGVISTVRLRGRNFTSLSSVRVLPSAGGSTSAGARVVDVSKDGSEMLVEIDARQSTVVNNLELLAVDNGSGEKSRPFRLIGPGPIVDARTPSRVEQGHSYLLVIAGRNLETATVGSPAGMTVDLLSREDEQLAAVLTVSPTAPLGGSTMTVSANGRTVPLSMFTIADTGSTTRSNNLLKGTDEYQKAARQGDPLPELLVEQISLSAQLRSALQEAQSRSAAVGCFSFLTTWRLASASLVVPIVRDDDAQTVGRIARTLGVGQSVNVSAYNLSVALELLLHLEWRYCPGLGWGLGFCFEGRIWAEVPGGSYQWLRRWCAGSQSGDGPSTGSTSQLDFVGGSCAAAANGAVVDGIGSSTLTQTACCAQTVGLQSEGVTSGGLAFDIDQSDVGQLTCIRPNRPVEVTLTLFIPMNHVVTPPPILLTYGGDNTLTWREGESFRVQQIARAQPGVGILSHTAIPGITTLHNPDTFISTPGSCLRQDCPECPLYQIQGPPVPIHFVGRCIDPDVPPVEQGQGGGLDTVVADSSQTETSVTLDLEGSFHNPLVPFNAAPNADWEVEVILRYDIQTGEQTYQISGDHDGFPAYQIRLNGQVVYQYDPILAGETPLSMLPPMDEEIGGTAGQIHGTVPDPQTTRGLR